MPDVSQYFVACAFILSYLAKRQAVCLVSNKSVQRQKGSGSAASHLIIPACASATKSPAAEKWWTPTVKTREESEVMTGLFRSLTLRSARHSLEERQTCRTREICTADSYSPVCLCLSSFWPRVFVLFSIFEETFTSKDLEDGTKSYTGQACQCEKPAL